MLNIFQRLAPNWWCATDDLGNDIPLTDVEQLNMLGESPLHIAAWKGDEPDIYDLLRLGSNINQRGDFGMTPLHYAYMGRKNNNVNLLLKVGADRSLRCDQGLLPEFAREKGPV